MEKAKSSLAALMRRRRTKSRGQSFVEFTILLPILLIMLSGLIEFGFMLNYYLDLIDAARDAARLAADDDALRDNSGNYIGYNYDFYNRTRNNVETALGAGTQITLSTASDDVVVSVFSINGSNVVRFPSAADVAGDGDPDNGGGGDAGWQAWANQASDFTSAEITSLLDFSAPNTGVVLVEVYFEYHQTLGLPWIRAFVPDPVTLHAYTIMPNAPAEPTPTPEP